MAANLFSLVIIVMINDDDDVEDLDSHRDTMQADTFINRNKLGTFVVNFVRHSSSYNLATLS